jgi:hypothetical protein
VSLKPVITAAFSTALIFGSLSMPAAARDTSVKVLINGEYWFCAQDPTGWPLADFRAVCSLIGPGGKGEFVEFVVDAKGKVRRKPVSQLKHETSNALRGSLSK